MEIAPRFAAVDLVHWEALKRKRDKRGSAWCLKDGVGYERRLLGKSPAANVAHISDGEVERAMARDRDGARRGLAAICRACALRCAMRGK